MARWLTKQLCLPLGSRRRWMPPVWGLLLASIGVAFFCSLGFWQLGRAEQKALMTARYEANALLPVQSLSEATRNADIEDRRVQVAGEWRNQQLVFLEHQMRGPVAGFHVHTVFVPAEGGAALLVNRGWVAAGADMQKLPSVPPASGNRVTGSLAFPSDFFTVGEADYSRLPLRVARLDMPQLSRALGIRLLPFLLRQESADQDGLVREWAPSRRLAMPPEKHRGYAFQWFSLALAVLVVAVVVNVRKTGDTES